MDLKLDSTGDLDLSSYDLELTEGVEAIEQHLKNKFGDIQGEWAFDTEIGFPYFEEVFVANPNYTQIQNVFMNEIVETQGVIEILSLDFEYENDTLSVSSEILTNDGFIDFTIVREL